MAQIIDFDSAKQLEYDANKEVVSQLSTRGTPGYRPPEYYSKSPIDLRKHDAWSIGSMFYEAITKKNPYKALGVPCSKETPKMETSAKFVEAMELRKQASIVPDEFDGSYSKPTQEFLFKLYDLLIVDADKRLTPEAYIKKHFPPGSAAPKSSLQGFATKILHVS